MTAKQWKSKIKKASVTAGTYKSFFDPVIATLADVLEQRDKALEQFLASGGCMVIKYTNKANATNPSKNPFMLAWNDLNTTALSYWKELGLTPSSFRKMTGSTAPAEEKPSGLAAALASIETD
ncbi:MAG: P27 family phage terminase small subunit [Oscillospiraceae bacterium]|nr:P27 family phage terminase small subunit [Oscillospiraceae bacterium]